MNTCTLDLNLLRVFAAIYSEHNVSRAARRESLSRPAMSNALARLRRFPVVVRGRQALRAYFDRMKPARRVPLVTNEVTQVSGDHAQGTCAMVSFGDDSFCGHYVDHFRKVDGRWLFARRQFFPYWPVYKPSAERIDP
jgi:hypothetical protein